jgi:hypothetical protein
LLCPVLSFSCCARRRAAAPQCGALWGARRSAAAPWRRAAAPLVWRFHSPGVCALCSFVVPQLPFVMTAPSCCSPVWRSTAPVCGRTVQRRARRRAVTPRCGVLQRPCVGARCSAVVPRAHATGASYCAWVLSCATVAITNRVKKQTRGKTNRGKIKISERAKCPLRVFSRAFAAPIGGALWRVQPVLCRVQLVVPKSA